MRIGWMCLLVACSGGSKQIDIGAPPGTVTQGVFSGPLCSGDTCTCREGAGDGGAGVPEQEGYKRFEVKLTSPQQLWMTVADHRLYKSAEKVDACFYVDLPIGETKLEMRASAPNGVSAQWSIKELGTKTKSWYDTFTFSCGNPGVCSFEELDGKKAEYGGQPKHDRCGSVKVLGIRWDTGRSPDKQFASELLVTGTLKTYRFVPDRPHGEDCSKKQKEEHDEENPKM